MWIYAPISAFGQRHQSEKTIKKDTAANRKGQVESPGNSGVQGPQETNLVKDDIIRPGDLLVVRVNGTPPEAPIKGVFHVEAAGTLPLGPIYGRVQVKGMSLVEAEKEIQRHLQGILKEPILMVTREISHPIDGML